MFSLNCKTKQVIERNTDDRSRRDLKSIWNTPWSDTDTTAEGQYLKVPFQTRRRRTALARGSTPHAFLQACLWSVVSPPNGYKPTRVSACEHWTCHLCGRCATIDAAAATTSVFATPSADRWWPTPNACPSVGSVITTTVECVRELRHLRGRLTRRRRHLPAMAVHSFARSLVPDGDGLEPCW